MAFPLASLLAIRPPSCNALFRCVPQSLPDVALLARALGLSAKDLRPKHVTLRRGGQDWSLLELSSASLNEDAIIQLRGLGLSGWQNKERRVFYVTSYPAALRYRFGQWHCSYNPVLVPQSVLKRILKPQEIGRRLLWDGLLLDESDAFLFEKSLGMPLGSGKAGPCAALFFCPKPWAKQSLFFEQEPTPLQALALKIRALWTSPAHISLKSDAALVSCPSRARILGLTLPEYLHHYGISSGARCEQLSGRRFTTYRFTVDGQRKSRMLACG